MYPYSQRLAELLPQQAETIRPHLLDNGQTVWVRRVGKTVPQWRYRLLGFVSRLFGLGALMPVPNLGGQGALDTEAGRLRLLASQNIPVPILLAEQSGGIMYSHLGNVNLQSELELGGKPLQTWCDGWDAVAAAHRSGGYLSQAFCRNMIRMDDGRIGFIDFEDDPAAFLPPEACRSRDFLCYLQSTAVWLKHRQCLSEAAPLLRDRLLALPPDVAAGVCRALEKIRLLRHFRASFWGNDTLRLSALAELYDQSLCSDV